MDRNSIIRYYKFRKGVAYPKISDLLYFGSRVNERFNLRAVKNLKDKNKNSIVWVKYEVVLTDFLKESLRQDLLSEQLTKVLTFTYPFHTNKSKVLFLEKMLLVLLEMNLYGQKGEFKNDDPLYYKLMLLFPNYRSAEAVYEETNEIFDFIQQSGKKQPHSHRNNYNDAFIECVRSTIEKYIDKNTNRVSFLQTDDPYELVESLEQKSDLQSYGNLITLTSFQGSLSRGVTLDYPTTFLMISDVSYAGDYYLAGINLGYNNQKKVKNSIAQAWARSLRTFKKTFGSNHPFSRTSNLRVLGFSSRIASDYASVSITDSIIENISKISSERNFYDTNKSFQYNPNILINDTLKSNYMLDILEGPNLDNVSANDLHRVSDPEISEMLSENEEQGIYQNVTDQLFATIRQYFFAENLDKYWLSQSKEDLEKTFYVETKTQVSDGSKKLEQNNLFPANKLNKDFIGYLDKRLKKELKTLQKLPPETEIKIKFTSGKGKFDKLRKAERVVEIASQIKEKSVLVSLSRIIGLPVYSELCKKKAYRSLISESFTPPKKVEEITRDEFDQIIQEIKKYSIDFIAKYDDNRFNCVI